MFLRNVEWLTRRHGIISKKMELFVTAAVRILNPTQLWLSCRKINLLNMKSVTERCEQGLVVNCTYQNKKNIHINTYPETFISWVIGETILRRHHTSSASLCGQGFLVGPHVLSHGHTSNHYRGFLSYDLPRLLEDVPLAVKARIWYMNDGASAYFSRAVRDVLRELWPMDR
jgi:hypothetical protein